MSSAFFLRHLAHPDGRERAVVEYRQMREQVELLKHHADLATDLVDRLDVRAQFQAVNDHAAPLPVLKPIDAAKQRRLAASRRARR